MNIREYILIQNDAVGRRSDGVVDPILSQSLMVGCQRLHSHILSKASHLLCGISSTLKTTVQNYFIFSLSNFKYLPKKQS